MSFLIILLIVLILLDLLQNNAFSYFTSSSVKSGIDGNTYSVVAKYKDAQQAGDMIARVNEFTERVIRELTLTYLKPDPLTPEQIKGFEAASILKKRYEASALTENEPRSAKETSFTLNKGEIISLCLREKKSGEHHLHSLAVLKFVMLHELAHIITPETTHSDNYWTNFRFLLEFCDKHGIYKAPDFTKNPESYCGMQIDYNPIYDNRRTISYFPRT